MKTVCAEQYGPPQTLMVKDVPDPSCGDDEVIVQVRAAGVGYVDGLLIQGKYQVKPPLPYFPGSEFAGVVSEVGREVSQWQTGDRVMGLASNGAYAEQLKIKAGALIGIPDGLDDAVAAGFFINYATALYGLRDCGDLQPGENLLVLGAAGGVGSAAISVAKAMGARIIAGASTPAKREACLAWSADEVLDYTQEGWRDVLKAQCPNGLNMVYDPVGGQLSEAAFRSLAPGGRFLVVGFAAGDIPAIPLNLALLKRSAIVGVDWGGEARANPHINQQLLGTLMQWIDAGTLQPAPVHTQPMADIRNALDNQLNGQIVGKLVLMNDGEWTLR